MNMLSPLDPRVRKQIADIALKSGGNRAQADKAIRTLAGFDHQFLLGLVQPYLDGIVAHALSEAMPQPVRAARSDLSSTALDDLVKGLHQGLETNAPSGPAVRHDPAAHADTIRALAAAQARRRTDNR